MTIVYLMRHSETLKYNNINNSDSLQVQNEKWPLTIDGENLAKNKSLKEEFQNIDVVYSSNYVRAISTAKYFINEKININEDFGERKFGINDWSELPNDFNERQFKDFNYKLENGESLNEVKTRELKALNKILNNDKGKKILIVGHSTALATLLTAWCDIDFDSYKYNFKVFFDGKWNYCETFKLIFDDDNRLINIENIK
jgi:2,3-bisphosphoglycerate-dependent phosphoglycerate mutase